MEARSPEAFIRPLEALYEAYIAKAEQLERDKKFGDGFMGLKPGPKDDPCHGQFAEDLQALLDKMLGEEPTSAQARLALEYIYRAPREHPHPQTVYWMFEAVHGMTEGLAGRLDPADAAELRAAYAKQYRRWDRLPAQKKALAALEKASRGGK